MQKTTFKPKFIAAFVALNLSPMVFAGQVYSGVDYQYFRDFAENKGKFTPGAQNIAVVNKKGESIGTMMQNAPMMDFSVVSRNGVAALVGDQYIVSVAHNVGYRNVDFGMEGNNPDQHRFGYNIVKRNNYKNDRTHPYMTDYHNPRLAKFVTEAAPIEMVSNMQGSTYGDLEKYPMRVRIGSGWQFLRDDNDNGNHIAMAYNYLTAGNTFMQGWANNGEVSLSGDVRHPNQYGPLPISGSSGDSGSPMFIYDKTAGKWLINGVLRSGHPYQGKENTYQIARKNYLDEIIAGDLMTVFDFTSASYDWTADGNGSGKLTKGSRVVTNTPLANYSLPSSGRDEFFGYGGPNPYMPALHHGKNIYFGNMENGTITLKNNIDQGAGGLTFEGDFVVQPSTDETWKGAGVSVSEGSTVRWKVKNPAGDRLSKIGQGTLLVNGKGENLGDISVGDGVVVLNQQADEQGKKQAFNQLGIVSGRPTVKLESADQVNPNNIYFGFRGGRLDLNGHSLTFNRIQNTDEGAQIVNHNKDTAATVTLLGNAQIDNESKINQSKAAAFNGWFGETNTGLHNGRLDVVYRPTHADSVFLLSGGTNLNGNITQENGTLVFSGRPTPHAYNHQNRPALIGRPQGEVVIDDDWLSRTFKAEKFIIKGGSAVVSRNVSVINGDWQLSNNANATLGVTDKQANFICARSDWTGLTKCANQTLSDKVFASIERSKINGNFTLNDNAKLSVLGLADVTGNVALQGQSQYRLAHNATQTGTLVLNNQTVATVENATLAGDATLSDQAKLNFVNARFDHQIQGSKDTLVSLSDNANWTLPSSTTIGNLTLNNSQITLNPDFATQTNNQTFNQLTVLGDLSGNGTFNYRTYLQENKGDHVAVHGLATGNFVLNVRNTGAEPQTLQQLSLLTLKNTAQTDNVNVALANGTVDVGTYRYELKNDNHDYRLYNPRKEQELVDQARLAEEKRKADEAARLAEEKRKAEEAQIAEAKAKAEELRLAEEQQKEELRLAEEKRKAEEAARLAEEKRKAEEAARLAEEKRKAEEAACLAEEKRKAEEAARLAEEKRKADEAIRLAEEKRKAEEAARLAEEKRKAEEAARLAEEKRKVYEKRKADEVARLAEEKRKAEEAARLAEEKRKADEAARLAEEKRKAEEQARLDAQRKALEQESAVKKQKELISRYANSALSELSASVNSALLAQDELNKHLVSENNTNVWANTLYSSRHYDADEFRAYQQKARLTQVGVQHIDTNHRLGLLFSHSRVSNAFDDNISSKGRLNMLSAFAKYDFENGLNLSADAGYGLSAGEIRGESQNVKIKRRIATIGMGLGYQLNLDKLAIRPHVGIHRYYISADSYTYAGVNVHSPKMSFNAYHAGVTVDYAFMPWEGVTIRPALTLNYVDASDSQVAVQVNQSQLTQRFDRYWQQEIGVTTDFASWQIATYAGKSRGKQLDKQYHIGLKVGYRW
ncbi:S6 family peptidase [Haemophilus parainfluenzae]|uniref:S6 family peptidase n=1 Tax=Haemophilus parainfluenzae ATCC 33392 TaxID=888828 RepID=A0ABD7ZGG5_HAEPA|nr:S6 family peptidase [Haemophilus parainfluenzae]EGC72753.1 outer membrane autotransporter barrel domain protein [Haemophilus parainfluenzae ATCC 33392]QQB23154.1 autotransporter outer membrane beta-barrel domain-containing protein [Haemophilus parainfluenzae]WMS22926.1 S6 family peptidase [Haemophilus parainfluenzae ATCC 33392]STO94457.1 Adhesion and penetration protein autotransporter precursor [Haemophilus parainfluenzae ATCC 33392]